MNYYKIKQYKNIIKPLMNFFFQNIFKYISQILYIFLFYLKVKIQIKLINFDYSIKHYTVKPFVQSPWTTKIRSILRGGLDKGGLDKGFYGNNKNLYLNQNDLTIAIPINTIPIFSRFDPNLNQLFWKYLISFWN